MVNTKQENIRHITIFFLRIMREAAKKDGILAKKVFRKQRNMLRFHKRFNQM